jgi:tetratricopeptide (TPR) repeat protein
MHGIACLLFLIGVFGGLGGVIYGLQSPSTHTFKWPGAEHTSESGILGHIVIGIGGAFVAVPVAMYILRINLEVFDKYWSAIPENGQITGLTLLEATLYAIAISVVGGYSGLRMISALSAASVRKLEEQLKGVQGEIEDLKEKGDQFALNQDLFKADMLLDNDEYDAAISILKPHTETKPDDPSGWLLLGYAYKRTGNLEGAIKAAQIAIKIAPNRWLYHNNLACYLSLSGAPASQVLEVLTRAAELAKGNEKFIRGLTNDPDFDRLRGDLGFTKLISAYASS